MTMHINLSEEMENFVRDKVSTGMYGNATEVIRDAVRRMQAEDARMAAWTAAIRVGDEQLMAGKGVEYTPDSLKKLRGKAAKAVASRKPLDSDVLP